MEKLQSLMDKLPSELDGALIQSEVSRLYLTGYASGDAGTLIVTRKNVYFIIDFRYFESANKALGHALNMVLQNDLLAQINEIVKIEKIEALGVESGLLDLRRFSRYQQEIKGCKLISSDSLEDTLSAMRMTKSKDELDKIARAQTLADQTFSHILNYITKGKTEREIALEMEFYMRRQNADNVAFDIIVVSGKNSSLPHGVPTVKKVQDGDFIVMDFGATIEGYRSDMTRTVAMGYVDEEQEFVYKTVLKAQLAALSAVRSGVVCEDIDRTARDIIDGAGYKGCFGHSLGHGVGVEIHEEPRFSPGSRVITQSGMVVTVEPGIYLEGKFGVRIEDMIVITENSYNNFTKSDKTLIIL